MLNPWISIFLVLALFVGLMITLRLYGRSRKPHPEILRKLMHVGMGLITLSFPWVFAETWPVWTLAGISAAILAITKLPNPLQRALSGVLDGVDRSSLGDIYFPVSVALVFHFSDRQPVMYCIPILLLTLADAIAALIGVFYGHKRYQASGGSKSVEGSTAFFTVAFLSAHIPLLLFTNIGRAETLLLSLIIGLLVMLIETVAWDGLDNLLIPLGGLLLLSGYMSKDSAALTNLLAATVVWVIIVFTLRNRTTLNDSAVVGAALAGYFTWSLGGWKWSVPPLLLYLSYNILWPRKDQIASRPHDAKAVAAVCVPGLLWLSLARSLGRWELFYPYTAFFAAQLAFIGIAYLREVHHKTASLQQIIACSMKGWVIQFIAFILIQGLIPSIFAQVGFAGLSTALSALALNCAIPTPETYSIERYPWLRQVSIGSLASALCLIPLYCKGW